MKKSIIYILAILVVIGGFFYFTLDKEDKDIDNNIGQEEELPEENENTGTVDSLGPRKDNTIEVGKKLPDFTLENMDGQVKSLRDYEGVITILNFWESWCPPCKKEMPDFERIAEKYDDVLILTVNMEKEKDRRLVEDFLEEGGYTFEVLLDQKQEVGRTYAISSIPSNFFIDKNGIYRGHWPGMLTYDQMEEAIESLREFD